MHTAHCRHCPHTALLCHKRPWLLCHATEWPSQMQLRFLIWICFFFFTYFDFASASQMFVIYINISYVLYICIARSSGCALCGFSLGAIWLNVSVVLKAFLVSIFKIEYLTFPNFQLYWKLSDIYGSRSFIPVEIEFQLFSCKPEMRVIPYVEHVIY